jgi:hypothetical protein
MCSPLIRLALLVGIWAVAAVAGGALHLLARVPVPALFIAGLTACFYLAAVRAGWLRQAFQRLGLRGILIVHLGRFVGFYFLWLERRGRLPSEFAQRAGWGDVIAAAGALLLLFPWGDGPAFRRILAVWNGIGLLDLVVAVGTATWLNATRPGSLVELSQLPLTLVPLFFVPLLLSSHLLLMRPERVLLVPGNGPSGALFGR